MPPINDPPKRSASEPTSRKRAWVRNQGQTRDHRCHGQMPGCRGECPPAMWGCLPCWRKLPKHLRDRIWAAYKPGQEVNLTPSREYLEIALEVQRWIDEHYPR